jgi:tetratricopeptide (TPR) repeat protein
MIRALLSAALLVFIVTGDAEEARHLFDRGDYVAAAAIYRALSDDEPASPVARYNLGTALLAAGEYEEARAHLTRAAQHENARVAQAAHYNLGNSHLHPAFAADPSPERREHLLLAVAAYKGALLLDGNDFDAKWNLELALRLLDEDSPPPSPEAPQGGGGAGEATERGDLGDPAPQPAEGSGPQPRMTPEEAEKLIASAEEREVGTQQERLRRPQPPVQSH